MEDPYKQPISLSKTLATGVVCAVQITASGFLSYLGGASIRESKAALLSLEGLAAYGYLTVAPVAFISVIIILLIASKKSILQLHWAAKAVAAISIALIIVGWAQSYFESRYDIGI